MVRFEVGTKLLETQLAMGSFMLICLTYQKLLNDEQIPETTTKESS